MPTQGSQGKPRKEKPASLSQIRVNDPRMTESLEEQLDHAAEEITGNSDDPPFSEEALETLRRN